MRYRIELSSSRTGFARVNLPDRVIEVEAAEHVGQVWQVKLTDQSLAGSGSVNVRADNANDAVWRVARAAVRAVSELTGSPVEGELNADPEKPSSNLS